MSETRSAAAIANPNSIRGLLRDVGRLSLPYFSRSEEKWSARGLLALVLAMNLLMVYMTVVLNYWHNAFYSALQEKDWTAFIELLFLYKTSARGFLPGFCWIAGAFILISAYTTYFQQFLRLRWRRWMTGQFISGWLSDRAFYRVNLERAGASLPSPGLGTDNPDQRIAEDVRDFTRDTLALGIDLLSTVVTLFSFLGVLWTLSGPVEVFGITIPGYMVWVALIYAAIGTALTHLVGRKLVGLNIGQQRVEADFRYGLVRVRDNAEGIAMSGGEREEQNGLGVRFAAVFGNFRAIMTRTKFVNVLTTGYSQVSGIFPIVVGAPRYFSGSLTFGDLFQSIGAFGQVQGAMSWFVSSYQSVADWRATMLRLATFQNTIDAARAAAATGIAPVAGSPRALSVYGLTVALPDGRRLLDNVDLTLRSGENLLITGRSGVGKSSLLRALAGIWPFGAGEVALPPERVMFLPQRPYVPMGTLRRAVAYPHAADSIDTATVTAALRDAGLGALVPRLEDEAAWGQVLSGGEQQRLAIARALIARPSWLFLDEATANLDLEGESALYQMLRQRLPDTTLVSVGHRPSLDAFHRARLTLHGDAERKLVVEPIALPTAAE